MKILANILIIIRFLLYFPFALIIRTCIFLMELLSILIYSMELKILRTQNRTQNMWKISIFSIRIIDWLTDRDELLIYNIIQK